MVSAGQNSVSSQKYVDESWDATILHIDMDAFFLSVELLDYPQFRGRPAVVGGKSPRSVVTSASYEAREFGIRSAMPMAQALARYPQLIVIEPTREKYSQASQNVMKVLHDITPMVEQLSIDEAFVDVEGARRRLGSPAQIASLIKEQIRETTQLPSTVGVAATKSLAKILSDRSKPDGIGVVPANRTREYLAPLPVNVIWGVGPKLLERLNNAAIHTVGDLAAQDPVRMKRWLGVIGPQIVHLARGEDPRPVEPRQEAKSVSVEHTFDQDITDPYLLEKNLLDLSYECSRRVRNEGLAAGGISVKVKDVDFSTRTKSVTLPTPATSGAVFFEHTKRLLEDLMAQRWHPVRLLGVRADRVAQPGEQSETQESLFELTGSRAQIHSEKDWDATDKILDDVAQKFPTAAIKPATLLRHQRQARMPDG
ncbi:MAG TPA: DNA polymerase IV [Enteractinococcus helveticum]|uniref:DNA polymerase IV n=1 Tax=Enteractinococcus helveticum TaxID=1837282 RepID=A0A921FNS5_9MICC|nr:DNA polymerase IV [Enteractinococcus helveticum]HJF14866.1 DNA polymerase IV [Enteractinococcus helveticum]